MKRTFLFSNFGLTVVFVFTAFFVLSVFVVVLPVSAGGNSGQAAAADKSIVVYCYDSFNSEWGPGLQIAEAFRDQTGISITFVAPGDGVTVLNQLIIEKDAPRADAVIGLDNSLLGRALLNDLLTPYRSPNLSVVAPELILDDGYRLLPYDYGYFAICYDNEVLDRIPAGLEDLTRPEYRDALVLMDPRTSTPGLGFLLWTVAVYGDDWPDYWQRLKPSILTITDGWSQAYALFTAGEAPMVLSYSTSPVYHAEYEKTDRYRAAEFSDGHPLQVEGMGIVKGSRKLEEAKLFIDFMLEAQAQKAVAMGNIMMPANSSVELPRSFDMAMIPTRTISLEALRKIGIGSDSESLIRRWVEIFAN